MSRGQKARLSKLEAAANPTGKGAQAAWGARYGWAQLDAWDRFRGDRIIARLMGFPFRGPDQEPIPEETPFERAYHEAMAIEFPVAESEREEARRRLLRE